ncbi:MAG: hypothetical protein IJT59_07135 [Desulfovibrionaceae bacterium]|nr:hypothetical protein [Desulfovibrionaceae bacterium]
MSATVGQRFSVRRHLSNAAVRVSIFSPARSTAKTSAMSLRSVSVLS